MMQNYDSVIYFLGFYKCIWISLRILELVKTYQLIFRIIHSLNEVTQLLTREIINVHKFNVLP